MCDAHSTSPLLRLRMILPVLNSIRNLAPGLQSDSTDQQPCNLNDDRISVHMGALGMKTERMAGPGEGKHNKEKVI